MAKKKENQSFVEMKEKKIEENIIDTFDKYEYIEPKKKLPIKNILFVFSIIFVIILFIMLLRVEKKYDDEKNKNTTTTTIKNTITTTTRTTNQSKNEPITETLNCFYSVTENNIENKNTYIANFHNGALRSDINIISLTLLNNEVKEIFDDNITLLKLMFVSIAGNDNYEISQEEGESNYTLTLKTTYVEDSESISNFKYNESIESVKQKMIDNNYTCN